MDDGGTGRRTQAPREGRLEALAPGQAIVWGGDRVAHVSEALAAAFRPGDRLLVADGALLHVPQGEAGIADHAVGQAHEAFGRMGQVSDVQISAFFSHFAENLEPGQARDLIRDANDADVESARARGRSTTRLQITEAMLEDMIAGLRAWRDSEPSRGAVVETVRHAGWTVEQVKAPLGVVGFVFEGRPNVFADATGVLRGGNTVVFRIGSDALGTARAIMEQAVAPALRACGLPAGAVTLVNSAAHAAGWAMFADPRLSLAVARGSGPAVAQLGAIARGAGTPVSLHGTGGAWMVADASANPERFYAAAFHSLDRKVCNTLNTCCIVRSAADTLLPVFLHALQRAGERRRGWKLHVAEPDLEHIPAALRAARGPVVRAEGPVDEPLVEPLADADLGREWEWEETPEVSLRLVDSVDEAVALFNRYSPRFTASLISADPAAHERFYAAIDAPFVGDGFTRWVDGQYALQKPELGLSNWENGRLFARGGVLAGDGVFTVRARVRQTDPDLDRGGQPTPPRPA
ncbi:aldehyde dehydrogenase family protein [Phenylobacterium sp. J367]|uniref:aldehyde dehydrogenase family protein n=1 Tax=Phenylobacterium sp. J367 TaxID=2898435 RepID=UPI002151EDC8|nr:aldehyde dehydrogenase family protein [Phenylobacterium sp. J367]MCR5878405.1 aldehyde dehydrogenase family protein [Phenylobacterium sp. J367]